MTWQIGKQSFGKVCSALLISNKPYLIHGVPWWMAREAGWASRADSIRAGGARVAGPAGQSSLAACWVAREAGPAGKRLQLAFLDITCFPHLSQPQKNCLFVLTLLSILFSHTLSSILSGPQTGCWSPFYRPEGMGVGASLEALCTQCWRPGSDLSVYGESDKTTTRQDSLWSYQQQANPCVV